MFYQFFAQWLHHSLFFIKSSKITLSGYWLQGRKKVTKCVQFVIWFSYFVTCENIRDFSGILCKIAAIRKIANSMLKCQHVLIAVAVVSSWALGSGTLLSAGNSRNISISSEANNFINKQLGRRLILWGACGQMALAIRLIMLLK